MLNAAHLPLEDSVCRIRELAERDAGAYAIGTDDALVQSYAHLPEPHYTADSVIALIDGAVRTGWNSGDLAVLTIADPATDDFCGSLVLFDAAGRSAEVGFWLTPDARGGGRARAALELAQRFARRCGLESLRARTVTDNAASQRVLASAGFTDVGRTVDTTPSGRRAELIHYEVDLHTRTTKRTSGELSRPR